MESKYKCPRCFTVSCCLDCVRHHKRAHACSGVRNKSRYIATSQFTDLDMLNGEERKFIRKVRMPLTPCLRFPDYRLLEEVDRSVDNYSRDSLKRITNKGEEAKPLPKVNPRGEPLVFNHSLPITFQYLLSLRDACKRRKTRIHFLPPCSRGGSRTRPASSTTPTSSTGRSTSSSRIARGVKIRGLSSRGEMKVFVFIREVFKICRG